MPRRFTQFSLLALASSLAGAGLSMSGAALAHEAPQVAAPHAVSASASTTGARTATRHCPLSKLLVPRCGVMFGAFVRPEGGQSSEEAFRSLERRTGSPLKVFHFYHGGNQLFPSSWEIKLSNQGHRLLLNWKPEAGNSWAAVANGASDAYLDREAAYLRTHYAHKKFFLVIHHEPEEEVIDTPGSGYTAANFAAMFRHVENRLRSHGVHNALYVMTYMGAQVHAIKPWYNQLWPGRKYVDWIGFDRYSAPPMGEQTGGFKAMVNRHWGDGPWRGAYRWAHRKFPRKPVLLAEWGASEKPGDPGWKSRLFASVTQDLRQMPNIKLISYFDSAASTGGDKRVDSTATSMRAWQRLAARPMFHRPR
jgi:hypothetical protein